MQSQHSEVSKPGQQYLTSHTEETQSAATPVYRTLQQFSKLHEAFPLGTLRHLVFNEESNGLKKSGTIVRLGARVLIHEGKFFAWLEAQNEKSSSEKEGELSAAKVGV